MAADLPTLVDLAGPVVALGVGALLARFALIVLLVMIAVFAKDPTRQTRALEVLRILRPPWGRQSRGADPRRPD